MYFPQLQVSGKLTFPNPNMYSLSTIANPGAIATAKSFTFTDLIETHHNAIFSNFAKSTDCHLTASQYLMTLQIEHQEIHDIVQHVVGSRSLVIMSSAVEANVDADVSNMSRSKLVYKTHHAVDSNIRAVNTEASVMYLFPSYMQPVFRCGSYAPEESFFKRLQREQQASKRNAAEAAELGEYARIDMMDTKCDQHARTLLQFLYLRKLLRKKVIAPMILHASYQEISSNLMYEDIRSRVRRYEESVLKTYRKSIDEIIQLVKQRDVEEVKRVAQLQQEEDNAVCACLFPTKKYAKIYSSTDSKVIDDYVQVIRKYYALLTELSTHASTKRGQHHLRNLMKEALPALQSILRKHHRGGQASAASHPFEGVTTAIEDQASDVTGQAELASSGKVNSPTSSSMKGSTKESQKAATRSSFMTSAKIGNSESLVSTLTQSAKQPSHSSKQVNNASNISSGFISILSSPEFQKFLKKYEKYLTSFDQKRCLQELQQEATHFMDATKYFRKTSWVTGQKVFLDSEGKHVNPTNMIVSKLTEMSRLYDLLYQIDASNFIDGGVAMDTSTKLKMSLGSTKNKIKKATPQKQRDGVKNNLVETHRNGDLMPPQNKTACNVKCAEKYLAGGLRKTTVLCRMIEDEMINNRGLVIVESFEAQSMEAWDLQYASTATEKLYMLRSGFLAAPICDGSFQKYANVLLKEDKNSQQSMGRFVSSFAYEATHQMLAPKASTDAIVVLPTIRECWNTLPSEVIRKRYTSLAHVYVTNKKHSALAMLIKTQAHIRGYLLRKKRQNMKGKKVMSRNIV